MTGILFLSLDEGFRAISIRYLSSYVKSLGHSSKIIFLCKSIANFNHKNSFSKKEVKSIVNFIIKNKISFVGMSVMTGRFFEAIKLAGKIKKNLHGVNVIFGGIHPTICPQECLKSGIDYVIVGEGEIPLKKLLANEDKKKILGLGYMSKGRIIINPQEKKLIPLDKLPFPDYDFNDSYYLDSGIIKNLSIEVYKKHTPWNGRYYYLTTTRGCPYNCSYCCNVNKNKLRRSSVDRVIQELREARRTMPFICGVNIQDDSFFMGSDEWLEDFCSKLKKEFNWPFVARIMPRFVNERRIKILKNGGLEYVSIGLQGSDRLNKELYKRNETSNSFLKACRILSKYDINFVVDVLLDNPYETEEDLKEVAETLNEAQRPFAVSAYSLTLFPGTGLFEKAKKDSTYKKFGTDAYNSVFQATIPETYRTPSSWKKLITAVISQTSKEDISKIIKKGVINPESIKEIDKLYEKYRFNINFANKIRNFNPNLFNLLLRIYKKIFKLVKE